MATAHESPFDPPSIDKRSVKELATLACRAEATNLMFLGPSGVGKTHLAVALDQKSIPRPPHRHEH